MSERVYVGEDLFGFQIGKFLIAIVAQEQRRRLSGRSPSMPERRI
jgi:hypothetical protein